MAAVLVSVAGFIVGFVVGLTKLLGVSTGYLGLAIVSSSAPSPSSAPEPA